MKPIAIIAVLLALAIPASAQTTVTAPAQPVLPFARVALVTAVVPTTGVYLVISNAQLSHGWYNWAFFDVTATDRLCAVSTPFIPTDQDSETFVAAGSCSALSNLRAGDTVTISVYHEAGWDVVVDTQHSGITLLPVVCDDRIRVHIVREEQP